MIKNNLLGLAILLTLFFYCGCQESERTASDNKPKCGLLSDCIVTVYEDSGPYLTEQVHSFDPTGPAVYIEAHEPAGHFLWHLGPKGFNLIKSDSNVNQLAHTVATRKWSEAILAIIAANGLVENALQGQPQGPINLYGNWYYEYSFEIPGSNKKIEAPIVKRCTAYRNIKTNFVEIVRLSDEMLVRGYKFRPADTVSAMIPYKVEIYTGPNGQSMGKRTVKLDYTHWKDCGGY